MDKLEPALRIKKTLDLWRAKYFFARLGGAALECAGLALWLGAAATGAAVLFGLSREQRLVFAAAAGLYLLYRFYGIFLRDLPSFGRGPFSLLVESRLPALGRHLRSALDLAGGACREGASPAFIGRHLEDAAALLGRGQPPAFASFRAAAAGKRLALFASGLLAAGLAAWAEPEAFSGLLHPFSEAPLESIMEIRPGNAALPRGSAFRIEAVFRNGGRGEPELLLKAPGGGWAGAFLPAAGQGRFAYQVENLGEDLVYRFRCRGLESAVYRVKALDAPSLKDPVFSVVPPAYTGAPATEHPYLPAETEALKGSLVTVSGTCAQELASAELVFSGSGLKQPLALAQGRFSARFAVFEDTSYRLELKGANGLAGGETERLIKAKADEPPEITLLSPVFPQLESAPQEEIKAVYEAGDDIGLARISLERKVFPAGAGPSAEYSFSKIVRAFPGPPVRRFPGEAPLELYDLPDGAVAVFRLSACDRSPAGQCRESGAVSIKVTDFDARHAAAYAEFEGLLRGAAALKSKEDGLIERLKTPGAAFTPAEMDRLNADWKNLASGAARLGRTLAGDPYTAEGALERYKLVERELEYGARSAAEKAVPATLAGRSEEALKAHKELSNLLGAGSKELEAMLRSESARSASFGFESMAQNAEDMAENMAGGGPETEGDWKKLERTLAKIAAELARIQEMLKDRPPKDAGGKTFALPAGQALNTAGELARAIERRDAGTAAKLAAKLAEALSQMRRVMEEYSDYEAGQSRTGAESAKVSELAAAWKELYEAQGAELSAGKTLEEKVFPKVEKARAAAFGEVSALQDGAAARAVAYRAEYPAACAAALEAAALLKAGNLEKALAAMEKAAAGLEKTVSAVKESSAPSAALSSSSQAVTPPAGPPAGLREAAELQRRALQKASGLGSDAPFLDPGDAAQFGPAAERQGTVEAKRSALRAGLEGEYSGELAAKLLERLDRAGGHMLKASAELRQKEIRPAVAAQLKALEELELGGEDLENTLQSLQKAQSGSGGKGRPSGVFARQAGGTDVSPVRLPKPGEYVPPEDLRRKVMDSLRERYPAARKELIEDYFKGITK
ncbi:MAG: hypothetical protein A3J79_13485 [Elusimicrobia bacterium RIFOXYB2_FULL_62_6]|nr:MAG: hypothetical protein A3J79_13485 [Elusimicrobia bacterium RIFOXYB2_FULL_62_6]